MSLPDNFKVFCLTWGGLFAGVTLDSVNKVASLIVLVLTGAYTLIKIVQAIRKGK